MEKEPRAIIVHNQRVGGYGSLGVSGGEEAGGSADTDPCVRSHSAGELGVIGDVPSSPLSFPIRRRLRVNCRLQRERLLSKRWGGTRHVPAGELNKRNANKPRFVFKLAHDGAHSV